MKKMKCSVKASEHRKTPGASERVVASLLSLSKSGSYTFAGIGKHSSVVLTRLQFQTALKPNGSKMFPAASS